MNEYLVWYQASSNKEKLQLIQRHSCKGNSGGIESQSSNKSLWRQDNIMREISSEIADGAVLACMIMGHRECQET